MDSAAALGQKFLPKFYYSAAMPCSQLAILSTHTKLIFSDG